VSLGEHDADESSVAGTPSGKGSHFYCPGVWNVKLHSLLSLHDWWFRSLWSIR
jgi:hypothetical protein